MSVDDLADKNYAIVGDGAYVASLLKLINQRHRNHPICIYVREENKALTKYIQKDESELDEFEGEMLVLGTNLFQLEMMERVVPLLSNKSVKFYDVLAAKGNIATLSYYQTTFPEDAPYLLYFAVNPVDNFELYLQNFFDWVSQQGVEIVVRHPLQHVGSDQLSNAVGVLIWNGSMSVYQPIIEQCKSIDVDVSYVECGFFPQNKHFYLDKNGVNAKSQLYQDDLSWVSDDDIALLEDSLSQYKGNHRIELGDYILVPLQVPTDSNIINHSRFNNGMQEFIDYIEALYPEENIWFKPHPKDRLKASYQFSKGKLVEGDLITLIAEAKKIHGINSSVLYEAALMGKEVFVEGDCLLKQHKGKIDKLLAAMLSRQFDVADLEFSIDKIRRFSHLKIVEKHSLEENHTRLIEAQPLGAL